MSTGKKVAGVIMSVFGGVFLFTAVIFAVSFLMVGGAMGNVKENAERELDEFAEHAVQTYGVITGVDGSPVWRLSWWKEPMKRWALYLTV